MKLEEYRQMADAVLNEVAMKSNSPEFMLQLKDDCNKIQEELIAQLYREQ